VYDNDPEGSLRHEDAGDRHDYDPEMNEINVRLRISYKTLVFAFVIFDVLRHVIDKVGNSGALDFIGL
jgi:hypothetical protein